MDSRTLDLLATLLTTTGAGAVYVVARQRQHRARRRALRARLNALDVDLPLDVRHLSPALAGLAATARTTRHRLETPLWRTRAGCDDVDLALADARAAVWEFLLLLRRLDAVEIALLRRLGLDPRPLRSLMYAAGAFERTDAVFEPPWFRVRCDPGAVEQAVCHAMDMLRGFEVALLSHRPAPYR